MDRTPKPPPVPRVNPLQEGEIDWAEPSQETEDTYNDLLVVRIARAGMSGDPADLLTKEEKERRMKGKCTC